MSLVVDEHRQYLSDKARLRAFETALRQTIQPDMAVLDLGSGSGILGLMACRAGARRVYSVDHGSMIQVAREAIRANGFSDRVVTFLGLSTRMNLPEKVDLVVGDQIGRFGFDAGVIEYYADARRRLLKPGGILVPNRLDLQTALVESPELWEQAEFWNHSPAGFDYRPAREWAINTGYPSKFRQDQIVSGVGLVASLDLYSIDENAPIRGVMTLRTSRAAKIHGVGAWFNAQMSPSVQMSNSPFAPDPIERRCVFFPIDPPVRAEVDRPFRVAIDILPRDVMVKWAVEPEGDPGSRRTHSTLKGMLITPEELARSRPDSIPRLNPWGVARRTILELCDGKRRLADIESEVARRHPDLFVTSRDAAAFVAEVVLRYGE